MFWSNVLFLKVCVHIQKHIFSVKFKVQGLAYINIRQELLSCLNISLLPERLFTPSWTPYRYKLYLS